MPCESTGNLSGVSSTFDWLALNKNSSGRLNPFSAKPPSCEQMVSHARKGMKLSMGALMPEEGSPHFSGLKMLVPKIGMAVNRKINQFLGKLRVS